MLPEKFSFKQPKPRDSHKECGAFMLTVDVWTMKLYALYALRAARFGLEAFEAQRVGHHGNRA